MTFRDDITTGMPDHFTMPEEFLALADWVEEQGFDRPWSGDIIDPDDEGPHSIYLEVGNRTPWPENYPDRIFPVISAGGDGSVISLWLNEDGHQQIVHQGSGSGSTLRATFPSAMSVLRLLAIGYLIPGTPDEWGEPPEFEDDEYRDGTNKALAPYRKWLQEKWGEQIPATGVEALGLTPEEAAIWTTIDGPSDSDPFGIWLWNVSS